MSNRFLFRSALSAALLTLCFAPAPARADVSHARIVRLSLVQGDVRFAADVKGDPLSDSKIVWERAELNLPIRQGYVVATDNGRAEVEFENGAMAFLAENTVLEFYDLSLEDAAHSTRLILRQGSAEFYVNPARSDYFSVTGGDFSVQAEGKTTFRLNTYDDGSDVNVTQGHVSVLTKNKNTPLEKGESLTMHAGDPDSMTVGRLPVSDEFDQWVSGRIDSAVTATNAALQYSNSYAYTSGFGDLYTYGSWFPVAGYGFCWRPYGVGFGWSPFDFGNWYYDPFFGWTFIGSQPWGWLPYHYGGWIFQPGFGWVWTPGGTFIGGAPIRWRPVTAVWVRSGGLLGIVPAHPMDVGSRTPLNLNQGVSPVTQRGISSRTPVNEPEHWKVDKHPPRQALSGTLVAVEAPSRVSRTLASESLRAAPGSPARQSGIVYDPAERRFINSNVNSSASNEVRNGVERTPASVSGTATSANSGANAPTNRAVSNRVMTNETSRAIPPRAVTPPPRTFSPPPSAPRSSMGGQAGGGVRWGDSAPRSSGASMPRSSGGFPSSGASGGARPSSGGRPH